MFDQRQPPAVTDQDDGTDARGQAWPFAWVISLNALDANLIKRRFEVVYPAILLGLVLLNGCVAFGAFYLASAVFFPTLAIPQRIIAGALIGLIVGFVDWMIIAWHPSLPRWFVAGLPRPSLQPARSLALGLPVAGLVALGLWAWVPDMTWPQRVFLALVGGLAIGVAHLAVSWKRHDSIPAVDEHGYPLMPDLLERLLPFMVRILLTALLSVVIGTGLSVAMNTDAVELARTAVAEDAAIEAKEEDRARQQKLLDDKHQADLDQRDKKIAEWTEMNTNLAEAVTAREKEVKRAEEALNKAGDDVRYERGDEVEGRGKCASCRPHDRGHTNAIKLEEEAQKVLYGAEGAEDDPGSANGALKAAKEKLTKHQADNPTDLPPPKLEVAELGEPSPQEIADHRAGMMGLAATLRALDRAGEMQSWPWWVRWGPEGVIFIVDIIPVLLKLLLGFQAVERRMWRQEADEVYRSLDERRLSDSIAAATTGAAGHRSRAIEDVARIRGESDVQVAEIIRETDRQVAEKTGERRRARSERAEETLDQLHQERLSVLAESLRAEADMPDLSKAGTANRATAQTGTDHPLSERPRPHTPAGSQHTGTGPLDEYVWFGEKYVMGPRLSDGDLESANPVHLAVRRPLDQEYGSEISTVNELISKCVVVKSKGATINNQGWKTILENYRDPLGAVNRQGLYQVADGYLINRFYQPRGDLRQYLRQLGTERVAISYRQLVDWMSGLSDQVGQLHANGWLHNDLKPANTLAAGGMAVGVKRLAEPRFDSLILTDFDFASKASGAAKHGIPLTPSYAAPESLDSESEATYHVGSREADVFGLGGILLYLVTGQAINHLIQQYTSEVHPGAAGWQRAYADTVDLALSDTVATTSVPQSLKKLLRSTLDADPEARPKIDEVQQLLKELRYSTPEGEYPAPSDSTARDPQGISADLINLFTRLGYKLAPDTKDFS